MGRGVNDHFGFDALLRLCALNLQILVEHGEKVAGFLILLRGSARIMGISKAGIILNQTACLVPLSTDIHPYLSGSDASPYMCIVLENKLFCTYLLSLRVRSGSGIPHFFKTS